jgi:hypothetical protein
MDSTFGPIDAAFRPLKVHERELLEELLEPAFVGRDELCLQLNSITAQQVLKDGTLFLRCDLGSPEPGCVMIHVNKDWYMSMLEILKYGPSEIIDLPTARSIVLL